jgi:hypothetical protein
MSACGGGNPFIEETGTDPDNGIVIPEELAGDLTSFSYDPDKQILIVRGVSLDDTPFEAVYNRRANLDVPGYEGYSSQESSLGRHTTAYVQQIDGARAAITVSGGQFGHYFGGSAYGRSGAFTPPDTTVAGGGVTYAGSYVGLLNVAGDGGDLLPVAPGTPNELRPKQAAEVIGSVFISADFADNAVDGLVYNRLHADSGTPIEDLELAPAVITDAGSFTSSVQQGGGRDTVGVYGGIFGGADASAVAGTLYAADHISGAANVEEFGLFVLRQCGTAGADPVCNQPRP